MMSNTIRPLRQSLLIPAGQFKNIPVSSCIQESSQWPPASLLIVSDSEFVAEPDGPGVGWRGPTSTRLGLTGASSTQPPVAACPRSGRGSQP